MAFSPSQTRRPFFRRRKTCPFSGSNAPKIDYKDVRLLQRYVSERGNQDWQRRDIEQKDRRDRSGYDGCKQKRRCRSCSESDK